MNRKQLVSIFFVALLLYILFNIFLIFSPFMRPIFWGMMFTFAFYPFYEKLLKRLSGNRNLASALITGLIMLAMTPIAMALIVLAAKETIHFYGWASSFVQSDQLERAVVYIQKLPLVQKLENEGFIDWQTLTQHTKEWILNSVGTFGTFFLKNAPVFTKNIISFVFKSFLMFFLIFFFLRDGRNILNFIYEVTPLDEDHKREIFTELGETFSATIRGQIFTGLIQGALAGIIFWILGLPLPIFFAMITFIASMIPVFGTATVWVPFVAYLGLAQQYGRALVLLVLGIVIISGIDNILKPILIGQKTKLPYPLLFIGILGGIQIYGFMGVFLAPAVLTLFFVLIKIYRGNFPGELG